jgi:hypothetical protein
MKNKKFLVIGIVVLVITLLVILLVRRERNVNVYEYPETLVVNNYTSNKNADTYSKIILNKIYDYDTINLNIYYAPRDLSTDEIEVAGFIQKNPFEVHHYNIFMKKGGLPTSLKNFLSHELIHLHQMEIGELIPMQDPLTMVYMSDTISLLAVPYANRPYEIIALKNQGTVYKKLNKLLYQK